MNHFTFLDSFLNIKKIGLLIETCHQFSECQCNGHSKCSNPENPGVCDQPCNDNTVGDHCEKCAEGYFGNPVNGGTCKGKFHEL